MGRTDGFALSPGKIPAGAHGQRYKSSKNQITVFEAEA
jgi:hypothetical protein